MARQYNHLYTVAFQVVTPHARATVAECLEALRRRLDYLDTHREEAQEAFGPPEDTSEEDDAPPMHCAACGVVFPAGAAHQCRKDNRTAATKAIQRTLAERQTPRQLPAPRPICGDTLEVTPGNNVMCQEPPDHPGAHKAGRRRWN